MDRLRNMKKIILLLLITVGGYSQTIQHISNGETGLSTRNKLNSVIDTVNLLRTIATGTSAVVPTLQQVVTSGNVVDGTLTQSLDSNTNIGINNGLVQINSNTSNLSVSDNSIDLTSVSVTKNGYEIATTINYFNVKDYGALGDGTTDDYTAINNAITASIAETGGVYLLFPTGIYKVGTQLSVDNSTITVNVIGNGATLKSNISTASTAILFIQSAKTINIDRLKFDLNSLTTSNHRGLRIGDYTNNKYCGVARITNCDFTGFGQESQLGMWVQNTPYISGLAGNQNLPSLLIDGCNFYNQNTTATVNYTTMTSYGVGLRIGEQTDYAKVSNCNFNYIRIGIWSEAAANLDLTNCNFLACFPKQSSVYTYGALYVPNSGNNNGKINVVACKFNHNYGYSIYFAYATTERPLIVSNCHFIANATTAIYMTHTSTISTQSMIQGNYFERCSQAYTNSWTAQPFGSTLQPFVYLNNQLNVSVKNNKFLNDASYAVQSASSSDYTTAQLNHVSNTTGTYSLVGSNNILEAGTQTISVSSNSITISNGNTVSLTTPTLTVVNGTLTGSYPTQTLTCGTGTSSGTDSQTLSISGSSLSISNGNTVIVPSGTTSIVAGSNITTTLSGTTYTIATTNLNVFMTGGDATNTSSVAASSTMSVAVSANTRYRVSGILHIGCNNTGGDKIQFTIPSGATMWIDAKGQTTGVTAYTRGVLSTSATLTSVSFCAANISNGSIYINGEINISSTSGTVSLEFAPTTNGQTATIYQLGTQLVFTPIN